MMMGGSKRSFSNFRENTAMNKANDDQMGDIWGKPFTVEWSRGNVQGDPGFCYLSGASITSVEKGGTSYPEMEHKVCCSQFYTSIYNIKLYDKLSIIWKGFL